MGVLGLGVGGWRVLVGMRKRGKATLKRHHSASLRTVAAAAAAAGPAPLAAALAAVLNTGLNTAQKEFTHTPRAHQAHLEELDVGELGCQLLVDGRDGLAGAAPRRRKVDDHRPAAKALAVLQGGRPLLGGAEFGDRHLVSVVWCVGGGALLLPLLLLLLLAAAADGRGPMGLAVRVQRGG